MSDIFGNADDAQLAKVVSELKGKSIDELITSGAVHHLVQTTTVRI